VGENTWTLFQGIWNVLKTQWNYRTLSAVFGIRQDKMKCMTQASAPYLETGLAYNLKPW